MSLCKTGPFSSRMTVVTFKMNHKFKCDDRCLFNSQDLTRVRSNIKFYIEVV